MRNIKLTFVFWVVCSVISFLPIVAKNIDANALVFPSRDPDEDNGYTLSDTYEKLTEIKINTDIDEISQLNLLGRFPVLRWVEVRGNSRSFRGEFVGAFPALNAINVYSTSGDCDLNLSGNWGRKVHVSVIGTSGKVFLQIPENIGVQVRVITTSGRIFNQSDLKSSWSFFGKTFENASYNKTPILNITVEVTSGDVYLR